MSLRRGRLLGGDERGSCRPWLAFAWRGGCCWFSSSPSLLSRPARRGQSGGMVQTTLEFCGCLEEGKVFATEPSTPRRPRWLEYYGGLRPVGRSRCGS
ncbi:hypothetical protein M407DRAFT_171771 [Tulasnella calospora MUT 4182]|uniref:Uncharacterized protein n=1 Tax=Tulasnella calospora MUT 4182 TaxID=1051891 RepID=A0A0C3L5Y7_9AGAM|nr:hypothetical protein M407DRAFT_171771 [Tulasnella calospora MUT 4182]